MKTVNKGEKCVLYDRDCIGCGECEFCDLDPLKICDNCGKCLNMGDYAAFKIESIDGVEVSHVHRDHNHDCDCDCDHDHDRDCDCDCDHDCDCDDDHDHDCDCDCDHDCDCCGGGVLH